MKTVKDRNYSYQHTKGRLKERYDIDLDMEDYDYLCNKIKTKDDVVLISVENQKKDTQFVYEIQFRYKGTIKVVWSEKRQLITTALKRG